MPSNDYLDALDATLVRESQDLISWLKDIGYTPTNVQPSNQKYLPATTSKKKK